MKIIAVKVFQLKQLKRRNRKKFRQRAVHRSNQLSYQANWELVNCFWELVNVSL